MRAMALGALVVLGACALVACPPRGDGLEASAVPPNLQAEYELFAHRCSKCHGLSRALDSGIVDDGFWRDYVTSMRRQPGSGISPADEDPILRFLYYYAAEQRKRRGAGAGDGG
jgi:hypothetical protein